MHIREATMADQVAIYDLEQMTFSIPWSMDAIAKEFENPVAQYFVAEEAGCIIGYVGVWAVYDEGQITNVAVHKAYRQRGIGRALIEALLAFGRTKGLTNYFLEVRASNVAAQKLYTCCGFQVIGKRKNYYQKPTEDALLMGLEILSV